MVCPRSRARWPYSTGKGSQHINTRYYFAVDEIKNKELEVTHCPTADLVSDYNSRPLQGKLFCKHRDTVMGIKEEDFDEYKERYVAVLKQYDLYENEGDLFDM